MLALRLVATLAAEASAAKLRGAALLDLLHQRCAAVMGDAHAHRLALRLLRCAAVWGCWASLCCCRASCRPTKLDCPSTLSVGSSNFLSLPFFLLGTRRGMLLTAPWVAGLLRSPTLPC